MKRFFDRSYHRSRGMGKEIILLLLCLKVSKKHFTVSDVGSLLYSFNTTAIYFITGGNKAVFIHQMTKRRSQVPKIQPFLSVYQTA